MDREKVIKAIECCVVNHTRCFDDNDKLCPYFSTKVYMCEIELLKDALALLKEQEHKDKMYHALENDWKALLKEQEAVKPVLDEQTGRIWLCGNCGSYVGFEDNDPHDPNEYDKYCRECGRPVLWEGR